MERKEGIGMQIGFLGNRKLYKKNKEIFRNWEMDCINLTKEQDLNQVNGLVISGFYGEKFLLTKSMRQQILERSQVDLAIWGIGYGAYLILSPWLPVLDATCKITPRKDCRMDIITVHSWQERFAVPIYQEIRYTQIAPNIAILCKNEYSEIILRQGNILSCTYTAEWSKNKSIYTYFVQMLYDMQ